ncbi:DUF6461 domain-containing protein [Streptomyces sp. NPDC006307]|uniref:DUF6461 domain-containing protein n=1 Tax=Streptomyces sp. NPDC006307 TaxID=3156748 RepID=UPI0033BB906F
MPTTPGLRTVSRISRRPTASRWWRTSRPPPYSTAWKGGRKRALAEHLTGVALTPELLDGTTFTCGSVEVR